MIKSVYDGNAIKGPDGIAEKNSHGPAYSQKSLGASEVPPVL